MSKRACAAGEHGGVSLYQQLPKIEVKYLKEPHGGEHESAG
jgi:hypothetical protein